MEFGHGSEGQKRGSTILTSEHNFRITRSKTKLLKSKFHSKLDCQLQQPDCKGLCDYVSGSSSKVPISGNCNTQHTNRSKGDNSTCTHPTCTPANTAMKKQLKSKSSAPRPTCTKQRKRIQSDLYINDSVHQPPQQKVKKNELIKCSPNKADIQCISNKLSVKMKLKNQNCAPITQSKIHANLAECVSQLSSHRQTEESTSESESDEWEDVEDMNTGELQCKSEITGLPKQTGSLTESIEIQIDFPGYSTVKDSRAANKFQWAKYVQWQVNHYNKAFQLQRHKAHLVCLLASALHSSEVCSSKELQALALSQVPIQHTCVFGISSSFNLNGLTVIISWFKESYKVDNSRERISSLTDALSHCLEDMTVSQERNMIFACLITLRALGLEARLVQSLQPISIKHTILSKVSRRPKSTKRQVSSCNSSSSSSRSKQGKGELCHSDVACKEDTATIKTVHRKNRDCGKALQRQKSSSSYVMTSTGVDSGFDFEEGGNKEVSQRYQKKTSHRKILSSESESESETESTVNDMDSTHIKKPGSDSWIEVFNPEERKWICVDCVRGHINRPDLCEQNATKPMTYVIAVDNESNVKDVTKRYASKWMFETAKLRVQSCWWEDTLKPYYKCTTRDQLEDTQLSKLLEDKPLPTRVCEYKNHHLYVLKRHLLKFEALYPETAIILGYCRGEPVFSRDCVHTLHTRETWLKQGLTTKAAEEPYKMVKARPRKNKSFDPMLPLYGKWQTEVYIPPPAKDGKVPRNEYGNVELFQPSMLPMGTVHLHVPGLNRTARRLGIDCAPAMVGWDYHGGFCHPVLDGFIVCTEFKDVLLDVWEKDQMEIEAKKKQKREKRTLNNWKRMINGILIRERLKKRFK